MTPTNLLRSRLLVPVGALSAVAVLSLAACGGEELAPVDTVEAGTGNGGTGEVPAGGGLRDFGGGTNGEIAAISGSTMQVQGTAGQVAVTWTDSTTFTQQISASLADVTVGSCVMVASASDSGGEELTAGSVQVSPATDGACTPGGGPGGPAGERPEGMPTDLPSDFPTDRPSNLASGGPGGQPGGAMFGGTFGRVTAVTDNGFTVDSVGGPGAEDGATSEVEVTVEQATTYTKTAAADASALKVGRCVMTRGDADDTGAVTATAIAVSDAVDGECAAGMRVRREAP